MKNELLRLENIALGSELNNFRISVFEDETILLAGLSDSGINAVSSIIDGSRKIDHGAVWINGERVRPSTLLDRTKTGVFMLHTAYSILPHMTVSDNLLFITPFSPVAQILIKKDSHSQVEEILKPFNLGISPSDIVGRLSAFEIRALEIIRSIYLGARIIVLEKPLEILSNEDTDRFLRFIQDIRNNYQVSILIITQQFEMFEGLFDRICIMKDGGNVKNFRAFKSYNRSDIYQYMLGYTPEERESSDLANHPSIETENPFVFRFSKITARHLSNFTLSCYSGEMIRIVDRTGQSINEIIKTLIGASEYHGNLLLPEGEFIPKDRIDTLEKGIAMDLVSEGDFLFKNMSWTENMAFYYNAGCRSKHFPHESSILYDKKIHDFLYAQHGDLLDNLDPNKKIENIRVTERQKLLLKYLRWIYFKQRILICENPFGTGDLLLRESVRHILRQIASGGTCVIILAGNIDEDGAEEFYDYTIQI